jgi:protein-tyrosine phosphatase
MTTASPKKVSVCFVCLGNICRSPMAEGIMTKLVSEAGLRGRIRIDSVGTGAWHKGERADKRARDLASLHGYELLSVCRQITANDFVNHDLLIAMDQQNVRDLIEVAPDAKGKLKVKLLRDFDPRSPKGSEVPDPYYGGAEDFRKAFELIESACKGLLDHLRTQHGL